METYNELYFTRQWYMDGSIFYECIKLSVFQNLTPISVLGN